MIATLIRAITSRKARPFTVAEDKTGAGPFGQLKVAVITDDLSTYSFAQQCRIRQVTPENYQDVLKNWRPDYLFIESAFHGAQSSWRYRLSKYPIYIQQIRPKAIDKVIAFAKDLHIPTLFWNKDDLPFFEPYLHVAKQVDYVFTADSNYIPRYQAAVKEPDKVHLLPMAYEASLHTFSGFDFKEFSPCFLGSYHRGKWEERRIFFDYVFAACAQAQVPLHIYDRQSKQLFHATHFRFPEHDFIHMHDPVPYAQTQDLYKHYGVSININSVTNSDTMLSRRFLEILACGGILLSNTSPAVQKQFANYCHLVETQEQATELLHRLKHGPTQEDKDRAEAGAHFVAKNHTWQCRLEHIATLLNL